jgi:N-acetylmuramoyl-L-alanine amidase
LIALCWINPFFHLVHREIRIIHEFQADDEAIAAGDPYEYAESLVWQSVRNPSVSLLHPFFYSPIKRRISMITQLKTRTTFLGRAMSLPLLLLLVCGFGTRHPQPNVHAIASAKPFTVVIDAGHGGIDPGAIISGVMEKDINLSIAKKIQDLSSQYNVKVLMTRAKDELPGGGSSISEALHYRAEMANTNKADVFLSIHTELQVKGVTGFNFFITKANTQYTASARLGSILVQKLNKSYPTDAALKQREERIYVLAKTNMPALLLQCGNMNNESDLAFIKKEENQERVAKNILEGLRNYADQ